MKKVLGFFAIALFAAALFTSCAPHKQACAAYSDVEMSELAE